MRSECVCMRVRKTDNVVKTAAHTTCPPQPTFSVHAINRLYTYMLINFLQNHIWRRPLAMLNEIIQRQIDY